MKSPVTIIIVFFLCVILFFLGFLSYSKFYHIVLPDVTGIQYKMDLAAIGDQQNMFAMVFAAVPLLLFFTWQLIPLHSNDKKTATVFIVIISMVLATYIRYKMLVSSFNEMLDSSTGRYTGSRISFPFEQLDFELYLLGGLMAGCIISYLLFHNKIIQRTILTGSKKQPMQPI